MNPIDQQPRAAVPQGYVFDLGTAFWEQAS
jgi:hypothetical protein